MLPLLKIMVTISEKKRKKDQINITWTLKRKEKKNKKGLSLLFFLCAYTCLRFCVCTLIFVYTPFDTKEFGKVYLARKYFVRTKV